MRLLNRTLLSFLAYSVIVLLIVTPVFYWVVNTIIIEKVNETLLLQKQEIETRIQKIKSEGDLKLWEDLDGDVVIQPLVGKPKRDSIYNSTEFNSFTEEMEPYRVLSATISIHENPYRLVARISLVESEDLIRALAITQLVVLLILLTGLFIINWWISRRIWKPFYSTLEALKKFEVEKKLDLQLIPSSVTEFEDLNRVIRQITDRDRQVFLNQKEFTENAAHEMQTPLAIFQSKLELLMQTNPTEVQADVMESLWDATSRLSKLNKALLLLSKIDNRHFKEMESVDVNELTLKLIALHQQESESKAIQIKTIFKDEILVKFNAALMDILLSNLLVNAIRHSPSDSEVTIAIEGNQWQIQNAGAAFTMLSEKIFDRFQKSSGSPFSTGLGLAIVKKICETAGLTIQYQYEKQNHLFSITFPESRISTKSLR